MPTVDDRPTSDRTQRFPPGEGIARPHPGDFILVRGTSWRSRVISMYERLCLRRSEQHYSYWSHTALVVETNGAIVEAGTAGVVLQHLEKYRDVDYHYVSIRSEPTDKWKAVRFATSRVGSSYSRLAIVGYAASACTGGRIRSRKGGDACGSLVARALACSGEGFERPAAGMLPSDLAKHYGVVP